MIVAVASGKGGTGKTMVAVSLALAGSRGRGGRPVALLDCDVETPNAALFLEPRIERSLATATPVPEIDPGRCSLCGRCAEVCAFHALATIGDQVLVFRELCHGCGVCASQCPEQAITERERTTGRLEAGRADGFAFAHGLMNAGEAMASPIIGRLKEWALSGGAAGLRAILDAPAGTACSLVQTLTGADYALLVTEPTPFGLHDLRLAVEVAVDVLGIPAGVVVNRVDDHGSEPVERFCRERGLPVLMRIPFDRRIAQAYSEGTPLVTAFPEYATAFSNLLDTIETEVEP